MEVEDVFSHLPTLETKRLLLRQVSLDDVHDIYAYGSNEEVSKYVTWETHKSLDETQAFVEYIMSRYKSNSIAPWAIELKKNHKMIGTIDFVSWDTYQHIAEVGYVISQNYWSKGIVTEAAKEIIKFGFNHMDLERIQAKCLVENIGSARVMEKAGMTFEGVLRKAIYGKGKHWDIKIYSILREEFAAQ
ncbi:ribosomal-protein-alanine N-acetyltransferase [Gracilibacillus orientalis]|uniref:Ribosomal-protein-alanine N-acetyltransferase n=1 Tax=Gracilibacillus orientalis TaxID=334253 RepID=A0A1I4IV14_9BACI|nr:GNAT family protein [Gracilibacillus orientalis]SFL57823.1 ribosomal-protein-alanine N-acetyltransferase [Gracilibacillus orientalis]